MAFDGRPHDWEQHTLAMLAILRQHVRSNVENMLLVKVRVSSWNEWQLLRRLGCAQLRFWYVCQTHDLKNEWAAWRWKCDGWCGCATMNAWRLDRTSSRPGPSCGVVSCVLPVCSCVVFSFSLLLWLLYVSSCVMFVASFLCCVCLCCLCVLCCCCCALTNRVFNGCLLFCRVCMVRACYVHVCVCCSVGYFKVRNNLNTLNLEPNWHHELSLTKMDANALD